MIRHLAACAHDDGCLSFIILGGKRHDLTPIQVSLNCIRYGQGIRLAVSPHGPIEFRSEGMQPKPVQLQSQE